VSAQAAEVLEHQRVRAVKVGALGSTSNVRAVAKILAQHPGIPVVVDTPMVPTLARPRPRPRPRPSGPGVRPGRGRARLLPEDATRALRAELLPRATLLTVNADEAAVLAGLRVRSVVEARDAARALSALGPYAVLVKGGHLAEASGSNVVDVLAIEGEVLDLRARRLAIGPTHGTGCTLAALVAGRLACRAERRVDRDTLVRALAWAKRVHHASLAKAVDVGRGLHTMVFC
jgi:hydroxymethylpyrimidine/phosphomethylpyrimidine kinase